MTTFGHELAGYLSATGLSQNKLARQLGVTNGYISRLVNNQRRPSFQMAVAIADILNLRITERAHLLAQANYIEHPVSYTQAREISYWHNLNIKETA